MRAPRRNPLWVVVAVAIVGHAAALVGADVRTGSVTGYAFSSLDSREYYRLAVNLAAHGTFSTADAAPFTPDTWRTPGYPAFLALWMLLAGAAPLSLILAQQGLGILNAVLLFRISRCWMRPWRAAAVAIAFVAEPYSLYYSLWIMATTLFVTVLLLLWLAWQRVIERGGGGRAALLGLLAGYLVLIRPVGLLVPAALLAGLIVAGLRKHANRPVRRAATLAMFVAASALLVGSWMARNRAVAGHFALSDQGGVVLAYFKATEVALWREGRTEDRYLETTLDPARLDHPHIVWERIDETLRQKLSELPPAQRGTLHWRNLAQGNRTNADSFVVSRALSKIGWSILSDDPLATVACSLTRAGGLLTFPLNLAIRPPRGVDVDRFRSAAIGIIYLLLVGAVLVRLARGRVAFDAFYFPLACTLALLAATTPQLDPRFRVPIIPLIIAMAFLPRRRPPAEPATDAPEGAPTSPDRSALVPP